MTVPAPHFLLFSEASQASADQPDAGRWRFVLEALDGSSSLEAFDDETETSAERLELLAIVRGLEALDQPSRVTLVTRNRNISRGLRYGLEQWRENDWQWERFGQMTPVKNGDLWKRVDQALSIHSVECRAWKLDVADDLSAAPAHVRSEDRSAQWIDRPGGKKLRIDAGQPRERVGSRRTAPQTSQPMLLRLIKSLHQWLGGGVQPLRGRQASAA